MPAGDKQFYAVYVPDCEGEGGPYVFNTLKEAKTCALQFKNSGARFKAFEDEKTARLFCVSGKESDSRKSRSFNGGEVPSAFAKPTPQELNSFRVDIEKFRMKNFVEKALNNPRLLITLESDSPTILHIGCRYNALHVAARCGNYDVCEFVLSLLNDCDYVKRLFPRSSKENVEDARRVTLSAYLNMPDKMLNATPLYFATKFGNVRIVQLLTSYKECNKRQPSCHGLLAANVVCESNRNVSRKIKRAITLYVGPNCYYVPLYRQGKCRDSDDFFLQPPCLEIPVTSYRTNSEIPDELFLAACAGPFDEDEKALKFYNAWKQLASYSMKPIKPTAGLYSFDPYKDMERYGRKLSSRMVCPWAEYWDFMKAFCDIRTEKGLSKFNRFLHRRHVLLCNLKNVSEELPVVESPIKVNTIETVDDLVAPLSNVVLRDTEENVYGTPPDSPCKVPFRAVGGVEQFCASSKAVSLPFIHGEIPLKTDYDVFEAIRYSTCLNAYPFVCRWYKRTSSYSEAEMAEWAPVGSPRERDMRYKSESPKVKRQLFTDTK
ncbi:Ank 2 domain containing protein [Trichuris trichiura]|uniref:Ank 2 domain containing protein n=1 Tax=Trichuris trichiura TaxID=36087 RepID=A0A077Z8I4_TRITR|nr:Ank 2 domain containing protein [Trichuris trichiura]